MGRAASTCNVGSLVDGGFVAGTFVELVVNVAGSNIVEESVGARAVVCALGFGASARCDLSVWGALLADLLELVLRDTAVAWASTVNSGVAVAS